MAKSFGNMGKNKDDDDDDKPVEYPSVYKYWRGEGGNTYKKNGLTYFRQFY